MTSILNAGPETIVNTDTSGSEGYESIGALADGGYVIVYLGDLGVVSAQRYDALGHRVGVETTVGYMGTLPSVAGLSDGGYVITWQGLEDDSVNFQRYDLYGTAVGSSVTVASTPPAYSYQPLRPEVTALNDGGFVVAWTSTNPTNDDTNVHQQVYNGSGQPVGGDDIVSIVTIGNQIFGGISSFSDSGHVVVWEGPAGNTGHTGIFMQRYDSSGAKLGVETQVDVGSTHSDTRADVAVLSDDSYVVVWQDVPDSGVEIQRFDESGARIGSQIKVSGALDGENPRVAALDDGGYVVTWWDFSTGDDVYSQRYDADGDAIGPASRVNTYLPDSQNDSNVTGLPGGGYVVAWDSNNQDGDGGGVYQRVYAAALTLNGTQYLYGTGDADDLDGGAGNDVMYGGLGDDTYHVNAVGDTVVEAANQGIDTVMSAVSWTLGANVENLTLTGSGAINGTGNSLDNIIIGNNGANTLSGSYGNDIIQGGLGNDVIHGGTGIDWLEGGAGNDTIDADDTATIYGDAGNDEITLGAGTGTAYGGDGDDFISGSATATATIDGGAGADIIYGGSGADQLTGGDGNDQIYGNGGNDNIDGGNGDDIIRAGAGASNGSLNGGAGNDTIFMNTGASYIDGGTGIDLLNANAISTSLLTINLTSGLFTSSDNTVRGYVSGIEAVQGSTGNDVIIGDGASNTLFGSSGDDVIDGGANDDTLIGGGNNDMASYASATAAVTVSLLLQDQYQDTVSAGSDYLDGFKNLTGSKYNDTLTGDNNNNRLDGGAGADVMKGGLGDDTYVVGNSYDNVGERLNEGTDTVLSSITYTLTSNVENLTLTGTDNLNATGNTLNNIIYGNAGNNLIDGGAGADQMYGGLGDDTYVVNNSFDKANENASEGTDTVQSTITFTLGANVENLVLTGIAAVNGIGNALNNVITGNAGNNVFNGGAGNDTFVFGAAGVANGLDHLSDFVSGTDHLGFAGADYGFAAGHTLQASEISFTGAATTVAAQFVYNATTHTLSWDANGTAAGGLTDIVIFTNAATPATGDFIFT